MIGMETSALIAVAAGMFSSGSCGMLALADVVVGRHGDRICAGGLQQGRHATCIVERQADLLADLAGVELAPDREVRAHCGAHGAHHFKH